MHYPMDILGIPSFILVKNLFLLSSLQNNEGVIEGITLHLFLDWLKLSQKPKDKSPN